MTRLMKIIFHVSCHFFISDTWRKGANAMNMYQKEIREVLKELETDFYGLSRQEVQKRHERDGLNELMEEKKESVLKIFLNQFKDLLVIILIVAAIVSFLSGSKDSTIVIIAVVVMNAVLGTVQSVKALKSLESLKKLSSVHVKVMRDENLMEISTEELCIGDIVCVEAGDIISGDGRVIESNQLGVDESSLTGESNAVNKHGEIIEDTVAIADQTNMVFSGSLVTSGTGKYVVCSIAMDTQIGQIATLLNKTKNRKTPLQITLDDFSKKLSITILIICAIVAGLNIMNGYALMDALMVAVALAVAAIPEALASIVTIVLAIGTNKMVKEHVIMKNVNAVESLGCVSVICSDKTGTLTQNKMSVRKAYLAHELTDSNTLDIRSDLVQKLLMTCEYCNNASIFEDQRVGDPMELALLDVVEMYREDEDYPSECGRRIKELPFDSIRKLMATQYELANGSRIFCKGACDELLKRCSKVYDESGIRDITEADIKDILEKNEAFAIDGMRVLGFAYREAASTLMDENDEQDLIFLGLLAFIDPPRMESKDAVAKCKKAGIKVVMITGDHKITARSIAKQIGIYEEGDLCYTGSELDELSEDELMNQLEKISVYARVAPVHKIRIVKAWQAKQKIVAMTGDGVNDAPALKQSDIGIAMGITGTEVSKDAASMILTDDNFASIVKAVVTGRNVYTNIKQAILYLLSGNLSGIICVLLTSLLALKVPFLAVHLLFINLVTDSLPAIAIGMEMGREDVLNDKPRPKSESILTKQSFMQIGYEGVLISIFVMIAYFIGLNHDYGTATTMAFSTLCLARLFHGFSSRSRNPLSKIKLLSNKYSVMAFIAGFTLLNAILLIPALHGLFSVQTIPAELIFSVYGLAFLPTVVVQIVKEIRYRRKTI